MAKRWANQNTPENFWSKVMITGKADCWEWIPNPGPIGYGYYTWHGKHIGAHRVAWMITNGEIPKGMCVCHKCDNRRCCNPNHFFLGTKGDNIRDAFAKGLMGKERAAETRRKMGHNQGEKCGSSKLKEKEVREIRLLGKKEKWFRLFPEPYIADRYGVTRGCVNSILRGKTWRWLK
jgi:hypothetical protein